MHYPQSIPPRLSLSLIVFIRFWSRSVCERCDPAVDTAGYTLSPGYHHNSAVAGTHFGASSFGLIFGDWANGCQILPDVTLPADKTPALTAALAAAVTNVGARATSAITAINGASNANQGVEEAWAWYHGDTATCPMSGDTCSHTPAEAADAMGAAFATAMTYGQAISRIKVQQGLVLLQEQYDAPAGIVDQHVSDLKRDVAAHMLIPFFQGVILSAQEMDAAVGSAERYAAQRRGDAYWKVIDDAVERDGFDFDPTDRATLSTMFAHYPPKVINYCAARVRLLRNLPSASTLQYAEERPAGSHATGTLVASAHKDGEVVHLTPADVGILTAADGKVCLAGLDGWQDEASYPKAYVNCGVSNTLLGAPRRVVTMTCVARAYIAVANYREARAAETPSAPSPADKAPPRSCSRWGSPIRWSALPVLTANRTWDPAPLCLSADPVFASRSVRPRRCDLATVLSNRS